VIGESAPFALTFQHFYSPAHFEYLLENFHSCPSQTAGDVDASNSLAVLAGRIAIALQRSQSLKRPFNYFKVTQPPLEY
jgi:hypothetical protein